MEKAPGFGQSSADDINGSQPLRAERVRRNNERKLRTAFVVKACYEAYIDDKSADAQRLQGLCMLTWLSRHIKGKPPIDNTKAVIARAFRLLSGMPIAAKKYAQLHEALIGAGIAKNVADVASQSIGFSNFYASYRPSIDDWMPANAKAVAAIFERVATAKSNADAREAYQAVSQLPRIPHPDGKRSLPAENLLTPVLACLDPRSLSPVINAQTGVANVLKQMGLSKAPLGDRFDGLVGLIRQRGVSTALELDSILDAEAPSGPSPSAPAKSSGDGGSTDYEPMKPKDEKDVAFFKRQPMGKMRRIHIKMENALLGILSAASLEGVVGRKGGFQFDVLVKEYNTSKRDLLIELKSDCAMPTCRLAVGQLFDYRRDPMLRSDLTDLAVLFPEKPDPRVTDYLGSLGIKAMWFIDRNFREAAIEMR